MLIETISRFEHAGTVYQLAQPLEVEVELADGAYVYHSPQINLWGYGDTRDAAIADLHENFVYLWREIALEQDDLLDDQAKQLKHRLPPLV
jgi:hypothetical protein